MQANEFDELLRDKYEEYTPAYNDKAWIQLSSKLPIPVAKSRLVLWPIPLGIAASVAAAIVFLLWHPLHRQSTASTMYTQAANSVAAQVKSTPSPTNELPVLRRAPQVAIAMIISQHQGPKTERGNIAEAIVQGPQATDSVVGHNSNVVAIESPHFTEVPHQTRNAVVVDDIGYVKPAKVGRTTISLAGGVQYGTLNAGYAAGVNVRRQLTSRWSIESDISYVKYSASGLQTPPTTVYYNGGTTIGAQAKQAAISRPIVQYFQATPGVAYSVTKTISVGAAIDLQRNIDAGEDQVANADASDVKFLPLLDVGAAGRAEFRISKHLKAGVIYRQGVNNVLQAGHNYLDRKYIQVQLKIPLLSK